MTKFQFVSDLLNMINALLEAGINSCNVNEVRCYFDDSFAEFEKHEDAAINEPNTRGDLELYMQIISNLHDVGDQLWKENNQ